jgi:glycosyltransferase involved in cell wall biosynthesis
MTRPLVSVVTGTFNRHELLLEAIENVRAQSYRPLQHVVVTDGPDPWVRSLVEGYQQRQDSSLTYTIAECGRRWSSFLAASLSAVPFQVAQWLARGDYLCWLADDEAMTPDHIESLVELLEATESDFVYSRSYLWGNPALGWFPPRIIGADPPFCGSVTNVLYRAELLDYRGFEPHVGSGTDWDQVDHWMRAGARWAMLDRVTHRHRVDKLGEGPEYRAERQPLRGHTLRSGATA